MAGCAPADDFITLFPEASFNKAAEDYVRIAGFHGAMDQRSGRCRCSTRTAMFGGTLPVHGGVRPSEALSLRLEDPVLGRIIEHRYRVRVLPGAA